LAIAELKPKLQCKAGNVFPRFSVSEILFSSPFIAFTKTNADFCIKQNILAAFLPLSAPFLFSNRQ